MSSHYSHSENDRSTQDARPFNPTELAELNRALAAPDFNSMSTQVIIAPIEAMRHMGSPFAVAIGYNRNTWSLPFEYAKIKARLSQNIRDAIAEENTALARQHTTTMLKLAKRISQDNNSTQHTSSSMKRSAYNALIRINKLEGKNNDKTQKALAAIQPDTIPKHPYLLILPVPSIHRAIMPILAGIQPL